MSLQDYYPAIIKNLPDFEGQFEAYQLEARNCDVLFATYPANTIIEAHSHPTENVGVITKGELLLTIAGETKRVSAGDWYHVPAETEHSAEFKKETAEIEFWFKR